MAENYTTVSLRKEGEVSETKQELLRYMCRHDIDNYTDALDKLLSEAS